MDINDLKQQIIRANAAYRDGVPVITDETFDELCDQYKSLVTEGEWNSFRDSLHETAGKVKHPFVMGSLDKIKADDGNALYDFLEKYVNQKSGILHVSAKVDGISCRLKYENGKLAGAYTRGDGYFGQVLTDKAKYLKYVPVQLGKDFSGDVRGELVIFKKDFLDLEDRFANPRNATAGIMNKKEIDKGDLARISFVAYSILGQKYAKCEQIEKLAELGFYTVAWMEADIFDVASTWHYEKEHSIANFTKLLTDFMKQLQSENEHGVPYEIDGLVLSDVNYVNEDAYRPDAQVAFKTNQQKAFTKLVDIEWQGPSKDGRFVPVAILEPVEISGTIVSKASLHNADFVMNCKNLKYGATVVVCKRGDIIPQIDEVL